MPAHAPHDDALTLCAIAALAFVVADVAHEIIGHGAGFVAVGGRSAVMTTTRLIVDGRSLTRLGGRIFSVGGPLGNLVFAGLAWLAQRRLHGLGARARVFLWLVAALNLLWAVGYLVYSGVLGLGDWAELVQGLAPAWLWRPGLLVLGLVLYYVSARALASEMRWFAGTDDALQPRRRRRLIFLSYLASGLVACAGALPDPRGASQVLYSAVPETFYGNLPLLLTPCLFSRLPGRVDRAGLAAPALVERSAGWIVAAALATALYVGLLGPGIPIGAPLRLKSSTATSGRNDDEVRRPRAANLGKGDRAIDGNQTSFPFHGKTEEIHVSHLAMGRSCCGLEQVGVPVGHVIGPERMAAAAAECLQALEHESRLDRPRRVDRMREHAKQPVLGKRTCRPTCGTMIREPAMRGFVVNVIGVEQGDEDVDVEERHTAHGSSLRLLTRAMVGFGLPAGRRGRSGTPLRTAGGFEGSKALRASAERTLPAVVPRLDAISLTA
jgi:hypothetical protein